MVICIFKTVFVQFFVFLSSDFLEFEVKWALENLTMNKASGGDGIPVELFQILKDNAVKMLHSVCQQILNYFMGSIK